MQVLVDMPHCEHPICHATLMHETDWSIVRRGRSPGTRSHALRSKPPKILQYFSLALLPLQESEDQQ
jgi:hypothetical protein